MEARPKRRRADSLPVRATSGTTPGLSGRHLLSLSDAGGSHPLSGMVRRERWGGHPGHDQGRRHSLPRVVAPQAHFPVARRSGHRSGCHRAAVWCGPFPKVTLCSYRASLRSRSRETREVGNTTTDQCRSFGGSITVSLRRSHSPARHCDQSWAISISTVNHPLQCGSATVKSTLRRHSVGMRWVVKQEA